MSEKIQIRHRYTNAVLFECEAPPDLNSSLHKQHALEKATQAGANLYGANIAGADIVGATFGDRVTAERGIRQVVGLRWAVTIFDNHMRIGCQLHTLVSWATFTDREIAEMDGSHALRFWRQHKAILLALAGHNEVAA